MVRRAPAAAVLLAFAVRERQAPRALWLALADALREGRATIVTLGPLSEEEAVELVGEVAPAIYPVSGGNPFYLEQLARVSAPPAARTG
jgi:hypothetical protein